MTPPRVRVRLSNVLRAMGATPWAILPAKLDEIIAVVNVHAAGGTLPPATNPYAARREAARGASGGAVAVLPIYGVLTQRAGLMTEYSGGASAEVLSAQLDAMANDPAVGTIVLDIDSPGGSTAGIAELADKVFAARGSKRVVAVANTLCASAAYWIGSQAHEVVASPSAIVGSVGVYTVHTETSEADEKAGITNTIIRAGKHKAEDTPYEPLSADARAAMQALVDEHYDGFVRAVARGRGVTPAAVRGGFGEGTALPAKLALEAGLVDRVAPLDDVLASLGAQRTRAAARADAPPVQIAALAETAYSASAWASGVEITSATSRTPVYVVFPPTPAASEAPPAAGPPSLTPPVPLVPSPAPAARSHPVPDQDTAATGAAPTPPSADAIRDAERARVREIRGMAAAHNVAAAQVDAWIDSGASVDAVSREILGSIRQQAAAAPAIRVGTDRETQRPWTSAGEFFAAVHQAHPQVHGPTDPRLHAAATGMNQGVASEGGYLVPTTFSSAVWERLGGSPDAILPLTDNYTVTGESIEFLASAETARTRGSLKGGVRAYWINEADQLTKSAPKFRRLRTEPQQLAALAYVTEKLLKNSPVALEQYLTRAFADAIDFEVSDSLIRGTGSGMPKGILNSGCLVTVSKETSQPAATIRQENVSKMWARLHPAGRANAIWMINADVEPALDTLSTVVKNVAGSENVGGYANKVFDAERRTLKGRPIVVSEFCETLGTKGDILLVDWSHYLTGTRGTVETAMSMHVRFEYLEQAFRSVFEVDGQPWIDSAITPYKGTNTQSIAIALETR